MSNVSVSGDVAETRRRDAASKNPTLVLDLCLAQQAPCNGPETRWSEFMHASVFMGQKAWKSEDWQVAG
jgi:hypothetical protein